MKTVSNIARALVALVAVWCMAGHWCNAQPALNAQQRIVQFKKLKLIETLALDEQTSDRFLTKYSSADKKLEDARKALHGSLRDLDEAVKRKSNRIKELTDESLKRQAEVQSATNEMIQSMRTVLDEERFAKYLVFEAQFTEQMRKALMDLRRERADGGGMGGGMNNQRKQDKKGN
jgi:hypothetical protein